MPELIHNGPIVPTQLLNGIDSRKVVFFCGAGVSKGEGSNLPLYGELVRKLISDFDLVPDELEKKVICNEEWDRVLGLLERKSRLGRDQVRQNIITQLTKDPEKELKFHKALIKLSSNNPAHAHYHEGVRLVTTNFDRRFIDAGLNENFVDAAPKLPIPDPKRWHSLVHLHGIITNHRCGKDLILNSSDLGRAYLTERWAARFITELFRRFIVVFVGYSLNDPVMRYMVDAIATESSVSTQFEKPFAFVGTSDFQAKKNSIRNEWQAKGVEPIIYKIQHNKHLLLEETLIEWARMRSSPLNSRVNIVIEGISKMPSGKNDPLARRVVWALNDPATAKTLSNTVLFTDEVNYIILEKWLDLFTKMNLLSTPIPEKTSTNLVSRTVQPIKIDTTRWHLVRWISRHLHVPQVFGWVLKNGCLLHPTFLFSVEQNLSQREEHYPSIPEKLDLLWTTLVSYKPINRQSWLHLVNHHKFTSSYDTQKIIEDRLIQEIRPYLIVQKGPFSEVSYGGENLTPLDTCGHLKLIMIDRNGWLMLKETLNSEGFLVRHAETLTSYLKTAHELALITGYDRKHTFSFRPSIAEHDQNSDYDEWNCLINLVRDSYEFLVQNDRLRAKNLLLRWVNLPYVLFKRLALHAITEDPKSDINLVCKILFTDENKWLWDINTRREILRFLRLSGNRLSRELKNDIENSILNKIPEQRDREAFVKQEKILRLHRLGWSSGSLLPESEKLLEEARVTFTKEPSEQIEFGVWSSRPRWGEQSEFAPQEYLINNVNYLALALENKKLDQRQFIGLTIKQPLKVVSGLRKLSKRNIWPLDYWEYFLCELNSEKTLSKIRSRLTALVSQIILIDAPMKLFKTSNLEVSNLIKEHAKNCPTESESEFHKIWVKVWNCIPENEQSIAHTLDDSYSKSLNHTAGRLAEAVLLRLEKYEPLEKEGFSGFIKIYFDLFAENSNKAHHARTILVAQLNYLYAIDPDWTDKNLLNRMDLEDYKIANDLWSAYSYSLVIGPNLLEKIKYSFLNYLKLDLDRNQNSERLVHLFTMLSISNKLTEEETREVIITFSEFKLVSVLNYFLKLISQKDEEDHIDFNWKIHLEPWIKKYWPKIGEKKTNQTTIYFLEILSETGDDFPSAVKCIKQYLIPVRGQDGGLYKFTKSDLPLRFPEEIIDLLESVVDDQIDDYEKIYLREILDKTKESSKNIESDIRFQKLQTYANS